MVWAPLTLLEEEPLREYLQGQKDSDEHLVYDFAFLSIELHKALKLGGVDQDDTIFSGPSQLSTEFEVAVQSVPSNFFNCMYTDLYVAKTE